MAIALGEGSREQPEPYAKIISYMLEHKFCKIPVDYFQSVEGVQVMSCAAQKVYQFDPNYRAYCLFGRAVSGIKKKIKETDGERGELAAELENAIFQLYS